MNMTKNLVNAMGCELCGRNSELVEAVVEGSMLKVCKDCSKFGNVIAVQKTRPIIQNKIKKIMEEESLEIVKSDFFTLIKEAREKLGLKQEELAKRLNEKESLIHKIESNSIKPSISFAKKLEKALGIKLVGIYKEDEKKNINFKEDGLTIGDLIKIKEKK